MSRLCRLRNKTHGEDGQWAYEEITKLRKTIAAQAAVIDALNEQHEKAQQHLMSRIDAKNYELKQLYQERGVISGHLIKKLHEQLSASCAHNVRLIDAIQDYLSANDPSEFGCACDLDVGYLCGPCHEAKQQYPLQKALAIPTNSTQILDEVRRAERERCAKVCEDQANEPECTERAMYCAEAIRAME